MRMDLSQQMKMDQRMVLAPRMIQSMEILQLPLMELQERIEQELLSNPLLELEEPVSERSQSEAIQESRQDAKEATEGERDLLIGEDKSKKDDFERMGNQGNDYDDYMNRSSYVQKARNDGERDRKLEAIQNTAAPSKSLHEHLAGQWAFIECPTNIKKIGQVIIDLIDDSGYLSVELEAIPLHTSTPATVQQIQEALKLVQTLEPTGVGCRDLAECMLLQLKANGLDRNLEIDLVSKHLKDIEMNRYPAVARKTGRTIAQIKDAIKNISRLDPRPGLQIGSRNPTYITPEIIIEYNEDDDTYTAKLTDGSTPLLRINKRYNEMLKKGKLPADAKEYVRNSARSARWLIESIEQRKSTLLRVVNHVIKTQRDFFDFGPQHLKPLPMVDVADQLGIHVGTVSRAVSGKYVQLPIGIYPLRSFFSGGTETASGESLSWDAVKAKLQEIIDNEDKKKPYNDDELVKQLANKGLKLARRTVAKYRSLMSIPPARRRKEYD